MDIFMTMKDIRREKESQAMGRFTVEARDTVLVLDYAREQRLRFLINPVCSSITPGFSIKKCH